MKVTESKIVFQGATSRGTSATTLVGTSIIKVILFDYINQITIYRIVKPFSTKVFSKEKVECLRNYQKMCLLIFLSKQNKRNRVIDIVKRKWFLFSLRLFRFQPFQLLQWCWPFFISILQTLFAATKTWPYLPTVRMAKSKVEVPNTYFCTSIWNLNDKVPFMHLSIPIVTSNNRMWPTGVRYINLDRKLCNEVRSCMW